MVYGRKSAASGQWCTILGSGVCGQDPSREGGVLGGVVLLGGQGPSEGGVVVGQWCTFLGSGVRGQDPSRVDGVFGGGVHRE